MGLLWASGPGQAIPQSCWHLNFTSKSSTAAVSPPQGLSKSPFRLCSPEHGDTKNGQMLPVFYYITLLPGSEMNVYHSLSCKTPKFPQIMKSKGCQTQPHKTFGMIYARPKLLLNVFRRPLTQQMMVYVINSHKGIKLSPGCCTIIKFSYW